MRSHVKRLLAGRGDRAASAVEYSLIVVAIAAIIVVIVFALGRMTQANFGKTCQAIDAQVSSSATCGA